MHATLHLLQKTDFPALKRAGLETLQVNLGYRCNQQCLHCHVNAGPRRKEVMERAMVEQVLEFIHAANITTLDLTGGAPELNPHFRYLVQSARSMGIEVIDRCNLTILEETGFEDMAAFFAAQRIQVTASLPCYLEDNVERQRGKGVFTASIRALQHLNELGYGNPQTGLALNLVYNPQVAVLPPPQADLERAYRHELGVRYGIRFTRLLTLANMPIQRFGSTLVSKGEFHMYMRLLRDTHQDANLDNVMCRSLISVDWQGYVYDCDFNQMLGLPLGGRRTHLTELMDLDLDAVPIMVADHCYGCTAGQGSSCSGALGRGED
jgi:radical SAM/Cys-rich protein